MVVKRATRQKAKDRCTAILFLILFLSLVIFPTVLAFIKGYERVVRVDKDAYILEATPDANYGSEEYLRIGKYDSGKIHTYYHFDVSSLSSEWEEAWIYVLFDYGTNLIDIGVNLTLNNWDEMTITWNNRPEPTTYKGHILCDGFDFRIPVDLDQILDGGISICLYGKQSGEEGYIQGYSKEGASYRGQIARIELSYPGFDPIIFWGIMRALILIGGIIGLIVLAGFLAKHSNPIRVKRKHKPQLSRANLVNPYIRIQRRQDMGDFEERLREVLRRNPNIPNMPPYMRRSPALLEKKINDYITLRFENNRTIIYVAGRRIIQCVHLVLNIQNRDVPMYDDIESIDEAADIYRKQGRNVGFESGFTHIPPEQEFWGHCSNIQAWVENDYDTRILMSNLSFPLLRELTRAGDPVAKRVYKEEVAQRLESGYPSVVQYLLTQGFIDVFTPSEFKTILEATPIIKNLSKTPHILLQFIRSCSTRFPSLIEDLLISILRLQNGKNIIFSMIKNKPTIYSFRTSLMYNNLYFLGSLLTWLKTLLINVEEELRQDVLDCIEVIENTLKENRVDPSKNLSRSYDNLRDPLYQRFLDLGGLENNPEREEMLERLLELRANRRNNLEVRGPMASVRNRCAYCGREIPFGRDICEWCGHRRDDNNDDFFPYPFIFRPPDNGGGAMRAIPLVRGSTRTIHVS